jgi:hypothetical protein
MSQVDYERVKSRFQQLAIDLDWLAIEWSDLYDEDVKYVANLLSNKQGCFA